eukprot:NODE_75_length_23373_cov_0.434261.p13 type:complete len:150 gc:universal NODE_75_length_23373_cov_0.434261:11705-11256(-)
MDVSDIIRESAIYAFVFILVAVSIRKKSFLTILLCFFILFQHSFELLFDQVLLSDRVVLVGAAILATNGYHIKSYVISFGGTYSILSKFNYFNLNGVNLEIAKVFVSTACWVAIWIIIYLRDNYGILFRQFRNRRSSIYFKRLSDLESQ